MPPEKKNYERQMEEELDAVDSYKKKNNKIKKRRFKDVDENFFDCLDLRKTKMVVEFSNRESARSKSFAVKKMKQNKNDHSIHVWQATNVC